jgi:hypothetical protein
MLRPRCWRSCAGERPDGLHWFHEWAGRSWRSARPSRRPGPSLRLPRSDLATPILQRRASTSRLGRRLGTYLPEGRALTSRTVLNLRTKFYCQDAQPTFGRSWSAERVSVERQFGFPFQETVCAFAAVAGQNKGRTKSPRFPPACWGTTWFVHASGLGERGVLANNSADLLGILWCCRCGLNTRPPPYQGGALPLSYGSAEAERISDHAGPVERSSLPAARGSFIPCGHDGPKR